MKNLNEREESKLEIFILVISYLTLQVPTIWAIVWFIRHKGEVW